ncbi:25S rRNA (uridine(2843)-N(3))-methyltransferase [Cercospora beticola]|uniref:25S rRNA (Uridine(2843)-N(3))-methyltransferase n=1 Tax=Cercospora beticola TaxID=122368 RepID=A0A2G5I7G0_CERBT|nr:25S rRNA (uridine(2843)-N(3))-methyltransferase [Cercospora beticola]PIB00710.1 25S rRNA (uridine(2843)-N(3))-methyltransferase [Cercospora beticola]WPA95459.1 hypothetical protein RHO25_000058 [Cercospora beticola]
MARGTESWKAASHKRLPQNKNKPQKTSQRKQTENESETEQAVSTVPLALQQKCLNIFRDALKSSGENDDDTVLLQEVKGHLYRRDFAKAFGKDEYLNVYAKRWSPSRALGYLQIFSDLQENICQGREEDEGGVLKVVCLGGGAGAELVALAAWLSERRGDEPDARISALFLDIAAWGPTVSNLRGAVVSPPVLSQYASAAAKAANVALLPEDAFAATFQEADALDLDDSQSKAIYENTDLITLLFTLNELYSTSVPKTQKMLAKITEATQPGAHLLVVDSPGSYSTVSINEAEKKYPMQWLLDHTLLGTQQKRGEEETPAKWEKVVSDESRWFRLPQGLEYRMELENMRYQIHLYRRANDEVKSEED